MKRYINVVLYWLYPQSGQIACLEAKVKSRDDLIQTIRANRQTIINECQKLEVALHKVTAERDEALHRVAVYESKADAQSAAQQSAQEQFRVLEQIKGILAMGHTIREREAFAIASAELSKGEASGK